MTTYSVHDIPYYTCSANTGSYLGMARPTPVLECPTCGETDLWDAAYERCHVCDPVVTFHDALLNAWDRLQMIYPAFIALERLYHIMSGNDKKSWIRTQLETA